MGDVTPTHPEESIQHLREVGKFPKLADVFEYLYEHVDEFESGDIDLDDIPHVGDGEDDVFGPLVGAIIVRSVAFGCQWEYHVPADRGEQA